MKEINYPNLKTRNYACNFRNSLLLTVPSVHHHTAFASEVHRICRDPKLRPNAITVELGHPLVVELVSFLKDLKQGGSEKLYMPCMLGLMKSNRFIDSDHIHKALMLQKFYRSTLTDLPDDLLSDRLNFSKWLTIFISPADSIIEAVRCAVELDIPVYGIDLNDFAHIKKEKMSFEDPQSAHKNMVEYGNRVMKYCDAERDLRIDNNRETFMVRGLKYCLSKHTKVLFVCGMAHWTNIVSMLKDNLVTAFPVHEIGCESLYRRVIVHPSLAATCMEIIPQITFDYERKRFPVTAVKEKVKIIRPETQVRNCLDKVYKEVTV